MATTVSKQYKLATDNGMLSSKYSEQQFVELLQDTNRRKAYYDFVKQKNPDFYSNDFETFSRNVDSMLANYTPPTPTNMEQAASVSTVPALPTNKQTVQSATEDKKGGLVSPIMSPHAAAYQAAENFANQQQKDRAERERMNNVQLHMSENDLQREKDLQQLNERINRDAMARNEYAQQWLPEDVKKQVQAGREENIEGLKQVRDELQNQRKSYMNEPKTLEEAFENYATAWTQNTEEGKAALQEVDDVRISKIEQLKTEFYNTKTAIDIFADVEDKYQKGNLTFDEANEELNNRLNTAFISEYEDKLQQVDYERNSTLAKRVNAADNGWLKRQQERILENGAADALDENYETISNAIAKSIEENRAMGMAIGNAMGGSAEMAAAQSLMVPPELKAALQLYQEAETLLYDTKKGEGNFWTFGKEIVRHSKNKFRDLATFGGSTIADAAVQANVLKKIAEAGAYDNPESVLDRNEQVLYNAIVSNVAAQVLRAENTSHLANAGKLTADMLPFVRDIIMGKGLLGGFSAAAEKGLMRGIVRSIGTGKWGKLLANLGKTGVGLVESTAISFISPSTYQQVFKEEAQIDPTSLHLTDEGWKVDKIDTKHTIDAFAAAHVGMTKELFTETGGMTQFAIRLAQASPLGKYLRKSKVGQIAQMFDNTIAGKLFNQTAYHGFAAELSEEWENTFYDAVLAAMNKDNAGKRMEAFGKVYGEFVKPETQVPMLISFALPAIFGGAVSTGQIVAINSQYNRAYKNLRDTYMKYGATEEEFEDALNKLRAARMNMNIEDYPQLIRGLAATLSGGSQEQAEEFAAALSAYTVADANLGAIQEKHAKKQRQVQQLIRDIQASEERITSNTHADSGMMYHVNVNGQPGYVVSGTLELNTYDNADLPIAMNSDVVTVRMEDGSVKQIAANQLQLLEQPQAAEGAMAFERRRLTARMNNLDRFKVGDVIYMTENGQPIDGNSSRVVDVTDEGVVAEIIDPNGQPNTTVIPHEVAESGLSTSDELVEEGVESVVLEMNNGSLITMQKTTSGDWMQVAPKDDSMTLLSQEDLDRFIADGGAKIVNGEQAPSLDVASGNGVVSEETGEMEQPIEQPAAPTPSKYPTTQEGKLDWGQMDVPTATEAAIEKFGDKNTAKEYAELQIAQAKKAVAAANKKKATSTDADEFVAQKNAIRQEQQAAQAELSKWENVLLGIANYKTAEEQAAAEQAAAQAAAVRAQRKQTIEGVGGTNMAERLAASPRIDGNAGSITAADGTKIPGHYVLVSANALTPSHNPNANFAPSEGYPTVDGQSINDRDYQADQEEQAKVQQVAQTYDGRAITNMPIVSDEGMVYSGNGRTMAGQLAAANGTDGAYTEALLENATQFGFTAEQVESVPNARVVFMTDERLPYNTTTLALFNQTEQQTQSNTASAAANVRKLTPEAVGHIIAAVQEFDTVDAFFGDSRAPFELVNRLIADGIISERDKAAFVDNGRLTNTGKDRLTALLFGTAFDEKTIRLLGDNAKVRNSVMRALPQILENKGLGDFSLFEHINNAIAAIYDMDTNGMSFFEFTRQIDIEGKTASDKYTAFELLLVDEMVNGGVQAFRDVLSGYNARAKESAGGQLDMFTGEVLTKEELTKQILQEYEQRKANERGGAQPESAVAGTSESDGEKIDTQSVEQIKLTDGRVVTLSTITDKDFALLGDITPIQRSLMAVRANAVQNPELKLKTAGYCNTTRRLLFNELPSEKKDLPTLRDIYFRTQQEYVNTPNKTQEYRFAADEVLKEIRRRLSYVDPENYPPKQGSAIVSRLNDAELAVAEAETDTNPTEAQKKEENYKQGHVTLWGLPFTIENPKGSVRRGTDANGKQWEQVMNNTYGKIRRTEGVDGDHIDVFFGPNLHSDKVFVVDQLNVDTKEFDEHKVMLGFDSMEEAQAAYLSNYEKGWQGMGPVTETTMDEFKKWINSSHRKTKPFNEYKSVKQEGASSGVTTPVQKSGKGVEKAIENIEKQIQLEQKYRGKEKDASHPTVVNIGEVEDAIKTLSIEELEELEQVIPNIFSYDKNDERYEGVDMEGLRDDVELFIKWAKESLQSSGVTNRETTERTPREEPAMRITKAEADMQEFASKLGAQGVHLINDKEQLPKEEGAAYRAIRNGANVMGWYNPKTNQVYIYLPNANNLQEVYKTLLHEFVAHKGLRDMLGKEKFDQLCHDVWDMMSEQDKLQYALYVKNNTAVGSKAMQELMDGMTEEENAALLSDTKLQLAAADEYMAHFAETGVSEQERSIWQRIVDAVRDLLRKAGINLRLTDADIARLLYESSSRLSSDMTMRERSQLIAKNNKVVENIGNLDLKARLNDDVMFKLGTQVADMGDNTLVGLHNLSATKLRKAIKQGGLANPSAAVIDIAKQDHEQYGEISLVMPSSLVDSATGQNAGTYTGDIWSPTYPYIERKMNSKGTDKYYETINKVFENAPVGIKNRIQVIFVNMLDNQGDPDNLAYWYMLEKGIAPTDVIINSGISDDIKQRFEPLRDKHFVGDMNAEERGLLLSLAAELEGKTTEDLLQAAQEAKARYEAVLANEKASGFSKRIATEAIDEIDTYGVRFNLLSETLRKINEAIDKDDGVDVNASIGAAVNYVQENGLKDDFDSWLDNLDNRFGIEEVIFDGYNRNGDRKYIKHTLENASRIMNQQPIQNASSHGGLSATRGQLVERMSTLAQIRANKHRLAVINEYEDEQWKAMQDEWFNKIINPLSNMQQIDSNHFINMDIAEQRLLEAIMKKDPIAHLNREYGYSIAKDSEFAKSLKDLMQRLKELPSKYFETKFKRPVYLNEFVSAVVPQNLPQDLKDGLANAGVELYEYDEAQDGSRREATLQATKSDDVRFSIKNNEENLHNSEKSSTFAAEMEKLLEIDTVSAQEVKQFIEKVRNGRKEKTLQMGRLRMDGTSRGNDLYWCGAIIGEAVALHQEKAGVSSKSSLLGSNLFIEVAKQLNAFTDYDEFVKGLGVPDAQGQEAIVWSKDDNVVKALHYNALLRHNTQQIPAIIERISWFNHLFPENQLSLNQVLGLHNNNLYVEVTQDYVDGEHPNFEDWGEVGAFINQMKAKGFEATIERGGEIILYKDNFEVRDLVGRNVIKDEDGVFHVIDANISQEVKEEPEIRFSIKDSEYNPTTARTITPESAREMAEIKASAERNGTYLKAPNGADTNLTPRQWLQVRTRAFKEWFGDWENDADNASKIVDENGEPMVVYHGTPRYSRKRFFAFNTNNGAAWFTPAKRYAEVFAESDQDAISTLYETYISMHNPANVGDIDTEVTTDRLNTLAYGLSIPLAELEECVTKVEDVTYLWNLTQSKPFADLLKKYGYDGIQAREAGVNSYGVFTPNQIKSATNNVGTFDDSSDDIRFRISNENQRIFVSNAEKAVEGIKQEKATPQQWLAMLEKNGGIKAGEDKWLGLSEWLKEQNKKSITKQEILDFISENQIQIEEVAYSAKPKNEVFEKYKKEFRDYYFEAQDNGAESPQYVAWERMIEEHGEDFGLGFWAFGPELQVEEDSDYTNWEYENETNERPINETRLDYTTEGLENKREIALTVPTIESWNEGDEVHFGDAGEGRSVAWVRFGETIDEDGSKVLVIDEIQSKRHQEGREKGYKASIEKLQSARKAFKDVEYDYLKHIDFIVNKYSDKGEFKLDYGLRDIAPEEAQKYRELQDSYTKLGLEYDKLNYGVPSAPFDKNWHELAMKRMLRFAAENGYDYVAWTTGAQQAERYDIGDTIESVEASDWEVNSYISTKPTKHVEIEGKESSEIDFYVDKEGRVYAPSHNYMHEGDNLRDLVGKELALQILQDGHQTFDTDNVRIGGEGMKGFYDRMLPSFVSKYTKKWGAKVQDINLPNLEESAQTMHAVNVTESMKEDVMEGQPMFRISEEENRTPLTEDKIRSVATDIWNKYQYDGELESTQDIAEYAEENMPKNEQTQALFDAIDKWRDEAEEDRLYYGGRGDLEPFEDAVLDEVEKLMKLIDTPLTEAQQLIFDGLRDVAADAGIDIVEVSEEEALKAIESSSNSSLTNPINGKILGYAQGGTIYLTKAGMTPETMVHEYTHVWAKAMQRNNRAGWENIIEIFKKSPLWDHVKNDPNYKDRLTTDDAICSEVLARFSGKQGAERLNEVASEFINEEREKGGMLGAARVRQFINHARQAIKSFWKWVGKNLFGITKFDSMEDVADRVLYDLLNATELDVDRSDNTIESSIEMPSAEFRAAMKAWNDANPYPIYMEGESLGAFSDRLTAWKEARDAYRAELWRKSQEKIESADPISEPMVAGSKPVRKKDETPLEYAQRLKQWQNAQIDSQLSEEYTAEMNRLAGTVERAKRAFVDAALPIEAWQKWLIEHGATMTSESNAYQDMFLAQGRVSNAAEELRRDIIQKLTRKIAAIIESKKLDDVDLRWQNMDVLGTKRTINGNKLSVRELIGVYCQAKDCEEAEEKGLPDRGKAGFKNNLDVEYTDIVNAVETRLSREDITELWYLINRATKYALDYDLFSGRISPDTYNEFVNRDYYVPQRGWRERDESGLIEEYEPVGKRGHDPYNAALVKARGRQSLAADPFAYIMSIDHSSIVSSENNKIKQKMLQFCLDNEEIGLKTGAFRVKKYWLMHEIDPDTGKIRKDEDGVPITLMSYTEPKAEDFKHDKKVKDEVRRIEKEIAKRKKALEKELAEHGDTNYAKALQRAIANSEAKIEDLNDTLIIAFGATNTHISQRTRDEKLQHEVQVMKDGQRYVIELQDEKVANAINKKFKQHQEALFNVSDKMRNATRFMSAMLTQYNPEFAASNFVRDFQVAVMTLANENPKLLLGFAKNFILCQRAVMAYAFADKVKDRTKYVDSDMGAYLREYMASGAPTGFSYMQDLKTLRKDFDSMVNEGKLARGVRSAAGIFSMFTEISETAVRFAAYVSAREAGWKINDAAYMSKELTTNFDRAGEMADSGWMSWFSFMRATINGNVKFFRAFKKLPVAYGITAAVYFAMGLINQFANPNDPEDEVWASDFVRENNFVIGKWRIPAAHFMRIFYSAGVNMASWMQGERTFGHAVYNSSMSAFNEILPNYMNIPGAFTEWSDEMERVKAKDPKAVIRELAPTPISPFVDVWANRNFMGGTINREPFVKTQENTKDILMAKDNTLPIYRAITEGIYTAVGGDLNSKYKSDDNAWTALFDVSGSSLEHITEGYLTGGMDMLATTANMIYDAVQGNELTPDKITFIRKFYNRYTPQRAYDQQYWLLKGRVQEYQRKLNDYEDNNPDKYELEMRSKQYKAYEETNELIWEKIESPTTEDVKRLMEANQQWTKARK